MYKYKDYYDKYGRIMQFNKNKKEPIHRWYSFVEGYSKEFIESILTEINKTNLICLEPFSGSGTTSLELQNNNMRCYAFEVNPLMYIISKAKLEKNYELKILKYYHLLIQKERNSIKVNLKSEFSTLYEDASKNKWNFDFPVGIAVEKLRVSINEIEDEKYRKLFFVVLSSILLEVSNLYRNGKCLSYKKNWQQIKHTELEVFKKFDEKIINEIIPDIESIKKTRVNNISFLYNEDSRIAIDLRVPNNSIDLVITSPPYLNSRDYTDTYILELKTLELTKNYEEIRDLRKKTIRSHVQVKWNDIECLDNDILNNTLNLLEENSRSLKVWNSSIIDMVRLYFVDMKKIFKVLYKKMKIGARVYFNVSNSAYFNVMINTLEICAMIAEDEGFNIIEIRKARKLKPSPQQRNEIKYLLEGVIVIER